MTSTHPVVVREALELDKLLELFDSHTNTANTLWGIFSTVALALIGFVYKDGTPLGGEQLNAFTFGFLLFGAGNCTAMSRTSRTLFELGKVIRAKASDHQDISGFLTSHKASSPTRVLLSQLAFIGSVVVLIWIPYFSTSVNVTTTAP